MSELKTTEFGFHTPDVVIACWEGTWSGDTEAERTEALELLSATIDFCFNPPDADQSCLSLLEDAVLRAGNYIAAQPCTCGDGEDGSCPRCDALGRLCDKRLEQ